MKKTITLTPLILSLITALTSHAAQKPANEISTVLHHVVDKTTLEIFPAQGGPSTRIDLTTTPIGEDDEDMTLKVLMKAAHTMGLPFCFLLCASKKDSAPALVLVDKNLHLRRSLPVDLTPLQKFQLYPGGKGPCFPPDFIIVPVPAHAEEKVTSNPALAAPSTLPLVCETDNDSALQEQEKNAQEAAQKKTKEREEQSAQAKALKKIKEDAKLKRAEQAKALQEAQATEKEKRRKQAETDRARAADAAQQAAAEKKAQEKSAPQKKQVNNTSTSSTASAPTKKKDKSKKAAANNDHDVLDKAIAKIAALKTTLPPQQASITVPEKISPAGAASADSDTVHLANKMQEEKDQATIQIIGNLLKNFNYAGALRLLPTISATKSPEYWTFLMDIYTKEPHLLSLQQVADTMDNAKKLIKKEAKTHPSLKRILYFGLALHTDNYEEKEMYMDLCLRDGEHPRARTYWERIQLEHYDHFATAACPKGKDCPHLRALTFVTDQQSALRETSVIFSDAVIIFLKLYLGSCPQIRAIAPDRALYINNLYDKALRPARYTQEKLDEIHRLIPESIIPLEKRVSAI